VRALNRTITTVRAAAQRRIREKYPGLTASTVRDQLKLTRASRAMMVAKITVKGRRMPLMEFAARQTKRGVTVRVTAQRKLIPHAFIATMKSGHTGVFVRAGSSKESGADVTFRVGKGSRLRKKGSDLPIAELTSISLPKAFMNQAVQTEIRRLAHQTFVENLRHEMRHEMRYKMG